MNEQEQTKIFSNNLKYYVNKCGKMQKEIAKEIGVPIQTFNSWCNGVCIPRMDKVQKLADYFKIGKSDLLDAQSDVSKKPLESILRTLVKGYATNKDASNIDYLVTLVEDENIQALIELARKSDKEDVELAIDFLRRINKGKE